MVHRGYVVVVLCDVGGVVSVEWGCAIDGVYVCGAREEMCA